MTRARATSATLLLAGILCAGLFWAAGADAATSRVDDSGTIVSQSVVPMRWRQLVPGRGADHTVEASLRVAVRLNLARWLNQPVRIYMALAPAPGEPVQASWRTQGRLLPGTLRSGARALIYEGVARSASLEETLELTISTDGRALVSQQALQFYFEVDTP